MLRARDRAASATVVLSQRVRPGYEVEYERWQTDINAAARAFPGFEGAEMVRPVPGVQDDYVVVYRFDTTARLKAWLESSERAGWLDRGAHLFADAPRQHLVATPRSEAVTVVASHRVRPGCESAYRDWQRGIDRAVQRFAGFLSTEVFEPSAEQADWVAVFRFDSPANLQRWLDSPERADWLERAAPLLESWELHKVSGGLGGWFEVRSDGSRARVAPAWKQAMSVLVALYPTVVLLQYLLSPRLTALPRPIAILGSCAASVAILTYALMPAVTCALRWWLDPAASTRTTIAGATALLAFYAAAAIVFWLVF